MPMQRALTVEEICNKLKPILGTKIDKIYFNYVTCESKETKEEILAMLNTLYQRNLDQLLEQEVLLSPPRDGLVEGEYNIGEVTYGKRTIGKFGLRDKDFPRHVCITGMSGSGKTTMAFNILEGLIEKDKPFLVFDWKKSFRPMLAKDNKLTCFTIGDKKLTNSFKLNINQPPKGVSPKEWISVMCDLITESFLVSFGVHKVILETLDEAYEDWGVYKGSENYPTWNHIKYKLEEKIEKASSREQGWIESALRVATVLTFGDFGEIVNYKGEEKVDIEDLMNNRVIFELNALGSIEKKFFCEYILMHIYKRKKAQENRVGQGFNYTILVDEAHNIFLKNKTNFTGESVTDMVYREMREYGVGLICLDQHISKLSDTVTGNSACHIAFQQQLPDDIETVSKMMHMQENKDFFSNLQVGSGVVKLADRYTEPFTVHIPWTQGRESRITDEQIKDHAKRFNLKTEINAQTDPIFNEEMRTAKPVQDIDLNNLLSKIKLPNLYLRASEGLHNQTPDSIPIPIPVQEEDYTKVSAEGEDPMEQTVIATIRRRMAQGEQLSNIENELEHIYEPSIVNKAMNTILESELNKPIQIEESAESTQTSQRETEERIEQILAEEKREKEAKQRAEIHAVKMVKPSMVPMTPMTPIMPVMQTSINNQDEYISNKPEKLNNQEEERVTTKTSQIDKKVSNEKVYKSSFESSKSIQKDKPHKQVSTEGLSDEEANFISFLNQNPNHDLTTVNLYKTIGLSPRKGNVVKTSLIDKSLLKVIEIKSDKGWKKIIQIA
jgi:energy-coupling factor transporter ATP-binding protein EcfA2